MLNFRRAAPKGASDFEELSASLKRCPDTKRNCSRKLQNCSRKLRTLFVRILPVRLVPILLIAALSAQQAPPTATIGPAPVQIAPPRPNYPFPDGRSYVYLAEWHLITAGTAVVRMEAAGNERKVTASAESSGAVNILFPVHDRFESRFDSRTF